MKSKFKPLNIFYYAQTLNYYPNFFSFLQFSRNRIIFSFSLIFILLSITPTQGQQTNNWYFGSAEGHNNTGLRIDFSSGTPVVSTCIPLRTEEGSSSISDKNGNPLFYTDGVSIWDASTNTTFGTGLLGGSSSTQSAIVMPKPGATNEWLVFTSGANGNNGINYYTVSGTPGSFSISAATNLAANQTVGEGLFIIGSTKPGSSFWVIARDVGTSGIVRAWEVSNTGIVNATAVTSTLSGPGFTNTNYTSLIGTIKSNTCQTKLAFTYFNEDVDLVDFDTETGQVVPNTARRINVTALGLNGGSYGIEFAPNDAYLYITNLEDKQLYKHNIATNTTTIMATITSGEAGQLQAGPDGKIYMAIRNFPTTATPGYLGVINNPGDAGASFTANGLLLTDVSCGVDKGHSYRGLPTFPKSLVVSEPEILPGDGTYCTGEEIDLSYIFGGYVDPSTLVWKALGGGHTFTPGGATSTVPNPKISFSTTGAKQVIVEFQDACGRAYDDTINLTIIDPKIPAGSITCNSNYIALTATGTPSSDHPNYVWYDAAVGGNVLGTGSPVNLYYDNTHAPASVWVEVAENVSTTSSGTNRSIGASAAGFGWVGNIPSNYSVSGINILSDNFILKSFDIKPYNGGGTNCNNFEFTVEISNGSGVVFSKSYNSGTFTCGNAFKVDVFTQLPKGNNYTITLKNFTGNISYLYGGNWGGATNANEISYPAQGAGTCSIGNLVYDFANYSIETSCSQRVKIDRNCTLPVDFTYFNATPDNDKILLVWGTAWEVNNDYFDIQHSIDGENFTSVAKVKGQGSTNSPSQYMAYHTEPVNGTNYYRIVQYDFDKQTTISQTIAVAFNSIETIQVRPNPSKDLFTIKVINGLEDATINVLDLLGRNLSSTVLTREVNEISIGESLEKGTYILQYVSKSGIQYIKVVKE